MMIFEEKESADKELADTAILEATCMVIIGMLHGQDMSAERQLAMTHSLMSTYDSKTDLFSAMYKKLFKEDISHITDKYEDDYNEDKMLREIMQYHFSKNPKSILITKKELKELKEKKQIKCCDINVILTD